MPHFQNKKKGCVIGNCVNGYGKYVYQSGDIYVGWSKNGKRHGEGTYHYVRHRKGSKVAKRKGEWVNGEMNGEFLFTSAKGRMYTEYWDHGEDITEKVESCRKAKVVTNAYSKAVGLLGAIVAGIQGKNIFKGGAQGWSASQRQAIPRAVQIYCR